MAAKIDLAPLPPFDPVSEPSSLCQRWKAWKRRFETYLVALNVTEDKQKRALLLYQAGQETQELFDTLPDTGEDYATAIAKLDNYFMPKKNVDYEIFQFRQAPQKAGETVDQFVTRLRKLAINCEFTNLDKELKSAVIQRCESKHLRRYGLRETNMTLEKLLAKARSLEISEEQASGIEQSIGRPDSVNRLGNKPSHKPFVPKMGQYRKPPTNQCRNCGLSWPHTNGPCPARGHTCSKCGKLNHYAEVCFSFARSGKQGRMFVPQNTSKVHQVVAVPNSPPQVSSSDEEYLYTLGKQSGKLPVPETTVGVNGVLVKMMVDTGASTDILDEETFSKIAKSTKIELKEASARIFAYGSTSQLKVLGKFDANMAVQGNTVRTTVHVLEGAHGSLLGYTTACELGLVNININTIALHEQLIEQYPHICEGIGKLEDFEVKLHIDTSVPPVAQPARRVPFHMRKQVATELEKLEKQGIIEKVNGPTPWVSPLVVIPKKNGDIRLCVDMRMPNMAIRRERHPTPTIDDLIHILNGATVFSKLDLRAGYHQLSLAPESRYITTFATHKGLRRYKRLNFGTNSAGEIFQHVISEQIRDVPGAFNVSDDVIVFGKTQEAHNKALEKFFHVFAKKGLTLNRQKCEFNKDSLTFFGFVFSAKGISPDPSKVKAVQEAIPPTSASGVRSFLGMATYCAKFIPKFSDITMPLRELTKKNTPFEWTEEQDVSFKEVKKMLTSKAVMAYFDSNKQTEVVTDASPWGLSAILLQHTAGSDNRNVVAYVSRSLSAVEQRYSQTKREALAIVWAVERLHIYLYGGHFTLLTDCKPLELILNNSKSKPPTRIERWNLRLQEYDFTAVHMKGENNPSDFLSRYPGQETSNKEEKMAEEYVKFLSAHAVPKAMSLEDIHLATKADATLQKLAEIIRTDDWHILTDEAVSTGINVAELKLFSKIRDELTVSDDSNVILRGTRIIIPAALRQQAMAIAHEGHQGLVKTKQLLREKTWFPGIDENVKKLIGNCIACQANGPASRPDPLQMSPLPPEPWHTVHMDFVVHSRQGSIC